MGNSHKGLLARYFLKFVNVANSSIVNTLKVPIIETIFRNVVKEFLKFNQTKFKEYIEPLLLDGMNDEEEHEQNPNEDDGSQVGDDGSQVGDVELQADLHKNNNGAQTDAISPEVEDTVGAVRASTLTRDAAHIGEKKNQYQHKKKTYTHDILVEMMHKMPGISTRQ